MLGFDQPSLAPVNESEEPVWPGSSVGEDYHVNISHKVHFKI